MNRWWTIIAISLVCSLVFVFLTPDVCIILNKPIVAVVLALLLALSLRIFSRKKEFFTRAGEEERMLRLAVENVQDGIIIADKNGRIVDCNKKTQQMLKTTKSKLLKVKVQNIIHIKNSKDFLNFPDIFKRIILNQESFSFDSLLLNIPNTDEFINIEDNISPIFNEKGGVLGAIIIFRDITSKIDIIEENTALSNKIERLERVEIIGDFLMGISQNFGNIISSISGSVENLKDLQNDTKSKYYLNRIDEKIIESKEFIKRLAIFNSSIDFEKIPTNINKLVENNRIFLIRILPKKVKIDVELNSKDKIWVDILDFDRILISLVSNILDNLKSGTLSIKSYDDEIPILEIESSEDFEIVKYNIDDILERNNMRIVKKNSSIKILFEN